MGKPKRILIRTGASAQARKAVRAGLALAKVMRAEVLGVHVRRRFTYLDPPEFGAGAEVDRLRAEADKEATRTLAAFERAASKARVRSRTERASGEQNWRVVLELARRRKCDWIATARDGDTGKLLKEARVPVLVVP